MDKFTIMDKFTFWVTDTKLRTVLFVIFSYFVTVAIAIFFLVVLDNLQNTNYAFYQSIVFAIVMLPFCLYSLYHAFNRPKIPNSLRNQHQQVISK